jgi:futalosine hydrolase
MARGKNLYVCTADVDDQRAACLARRFCHWNQCSATSPEIRVLEHTLDFVAVDLVACVATEMEGVLLRPHLPVLCTGVGAVNAAIALTRFLEREGAKAIVVCGIGGAYPAAGIPIGSAVWATTECYGDLGADSPQGFLDMRAMGFPVISGPAPLYNTIPLQIVPEGARAPFVTLNTCTGDNDRARQISERTGAGVENMEGAAIAHVAAIYGIPCGEVRGISNLVGKRDRAAWRLKEAVAAAQEAFLAGLRQLEMIR